MRVAEYIVLATGCVSLGLVITFVVLLVCQYLGIDVFRNLWLLAVPTFLSVALNVILIEVYKRHRKKR